MDQKKEFVMSLEKEIFTPALQQAVKAAKAKDAKVADVIGAVANAYMNMLTMLVGNPVAAADMMKAQADYLKTADDPATDEGTA